MSFPAGNTGFQLGGGGDAPKQAAPALGLPIAKPTFGAAAGTGSAVGFGGFGSPSAGAPTAFSTPAISAAPSTGFSFGASAAPAAPAPSFGATPASQGSFNFGSSLSLGSTAVTAPAASSGFGLGSLSSAVTPNTSAFSLGAAPALSTAAPAAAATPAPAMSAPVLGFGPPSTSSVPTASSFSFGASATTPAPTGFSLGGATSTTSVSTGFSLSTSVPTTSATGFSLGVGTSVPSAATTSTAPTTTSAVSFSFPTSSSTTTSGFGLNTTSAPNLTFNLGGIANSTATISGTTTTTTDATQSIPVTSLNFIQLEETINKWTMDLEEQEKLFLLQATQVNAWDRTLTSNSEKIEALNRAVEAVKLEQQRLDNELEFICSQQRELEDCLIPLEKELAGNAVTDPEREHTYDLAASMDTQLKQMSEDLKEIIENLNERNRAQDSSDPLVQIGRILNSHMDSLQWIENNTHAIQNHLDHVSKLHESHRRDNERSFHLTYD